MQPLYGISRHVQYAMLALKKIMRVVIGHYLVSVAYLRGHVLHRLH